MDKGTKGIINGLILGILAWALIFWGASKAFSFDYDGDGYPDCLCGELKEEWQCRPCVFIPFTVLQGQVICENTTTPVANEPVHWERKYVPSIQNTLLTNEKGEYWDLTFSGIFNVTVGDQTRQTMGIIKQKWEIPCVTTTTTICKTTTPATTSKGLTTSVPNTTTIAPTTTSALPVTTSVPHATTSIVSSTSVRPVTTTTVHPTTTIKPTTTLEPSSTTTIDNRRCELQCKDRCDRKPFDILLAKFFPRIYSRMMAQRENGDDCYRECVKECNPLNKD
jgi:hypothetical protein